MTNTNVRSPLTVPVGRGRGWEDRGGAEARSGMMPGGSGVSM